MKIQNFMLSWFNNVLFVMLGLFMLTTAEAAELVFSPATPTVVVGQQISLSVSGTSGEITWNPTKGQIQGTGNRVTYIAPAQAGLDVVTAFDSEGNVSTVKITVTPKQLVSLENANWEVFKNRKKINAITLSKDRETLWVATAGGLEQREANGRFIKVFTNIDGLLGVINTVYADDKGILWVGGTATGLARRSETGQWEFFNPSNSDLPSYTLSAIQPDGIGGLWIGMIGFPREGGIAHFTATGQWEIFTTENSDLPWGDIQMLTLDKNQQLWAAGYNGNLEIFRFDEDNNSIKAPYPGPGLIHRTSAGTWEVFSPENSDLPSYDIQALYPDDKGGLWVSTGDKGLAYRASDGHWEIFNVENSGLPSNNLHDIMADGNGGLWVGLADGRLVHKTVNGNWEIRFESQHAQLIEDVANMRGMFIDDKQQLWFGNAEGLIRLTLDDKRMHFDTSVLPSNYVRALVLEKNGLWIGTSDKGLAHRNTNGGWKIFTQSNSELPSNQINVLLSDKQGGLWIGTDKGLAHRTVQSDWQIFPLENAGIPSNYINTLSPDGQNGLWVGIGTKVIESENEPMMQFGGIAHRDATGQWEIFTTSTSGLPSDNVTALHTDGQGGLWVGTTAVYRENGSTRPLALEPSGGLAHFTVAGTWEVFTTENAGLPHNDIKVIHLDNNAELWIGTGYRYFDDGKGLAHRFVDGHWEVFDTANPIVEGTIILQNTILSLSADGRGGLWVGTLGGGIAHRKSDGSWERLATGNSGIPGNEVYALSAEKNGSGGLWVGTNNGLANMTFTQKNTLCTNLNDAQCQNIQTDKRAAILIHPRGQGTGYKQDVSIEFMATHAYRTLHNRGYDNDEIYFLSYKPDVDINGDGFIDRNVVDGPITAFDLAAGTSPRDLTRADIQQTFDWANQKGQLDQPLLVIFIDHALTGKLRLDPFDEVLTAQDLNAMLTDYQQATGSQVVVVLEACRTGSLVSELSGPNRLIVTSTAEDLAYYDNLGSFSFSKFYFDNLRRGESFYDAFQTVSSKLSTFGHPFNLQAPQLDDDGDGIANTTNDGSLARKLCLNGCFGALSGEITLAPETSAATVTAGQTVSLVVRAGITEGRIKRVWALIMTPEAAKQRNDQGFSLIPTPVVNLNQDDTSRWQGSFSGFKYRGDYVVTFMAEDNEGFITAATPVVLTQPEGPEAPDIATSAAPIIAQTVYHDGDMFKATLPPLPTGQTQYVGVALPDGTIFVLTGLNGFVPFDGVTLPVWQSGDIAIDLPVSADIPRGEYVLYLLRVPAGVEPMANQELWKLGVSGFKVD